MVALHLGQHPLAQAQKALGLALARDLAVLENRLLHILASLVPSVVHDGPLCQVHQDPPHLGRPAI